MPFSAYLLVKAMHIAFMVTWFAGLFYLPRLFVYHAMAEDQPSRERFKIMERKLYRGIMNPSMIVTVVLGMWMFMANMEAYKGNGWMHAKLSLVVLLVIYHFMCGAQMKRFARGENQRTHVFYRWFNEAPVLVLLGVVILVVVKPF